MKLYKKHKQIVQMHFALDMVDGVLYVTINVPDENGRLVPAILTSQGELYGPDEWPAQQKERGLQTITDELKLDGNSRWNIESIEAFIESKLLAPQWDNVFASIYEALDHMLVVRDRRILTVLTLYAMMTYFQPLFDFLPILHMRGPAESGKSRAGAALAEIAFNGKMDGSPTQSAIMRKAHEAKYTQVIAECDNLANIGSGDSLARLLHSGCTKAEAWVELAEGKQNRGFAPVRYYIYNPKVLLSTLPFKSQPLRSRCIRLDLVKVAGADERKLRTKHNNETWNELRDSLYRLQLLSWKEVEQTRDWVKNNWNGVKGRTFDKWLPLVSVAKLVSEEVFQEVIELAKESQEEQQQEAGNMFEAIPFQFARYLVQRESQFLSEGQIWKEFIEPASTFERVASDQKPVWAEETQTSVTIEQLNKWIRTPRGLVQELKRLDLIPKDPKKKNDGNKYMFDQEHVRGIADAYLGEYVPNDFSYLY